jgi:hypothetical protein
MSGQREAEGGSRISARVGVITFPGTLDDVDAARAVRLRLSVPFDGRVADAWAQTWPINGLPDGERTVVVEIAAPIGLPEGRALIAVELEGEPGRSTPRRRGGALPIG